MKHRARALVLLQLLPGASHGRLLNQVSELKSAGVDGFSENKLVGIVPAGLVGEWARAAGIRGSDPNYAEKLKEVVKQKMLDGEFAKLRVWEGNY